MKTAKVLAAVVVMATLTACNKHQKVNARIIERKHLLQNQLQLKYTFTYNSQTYVDSFTVANNVYNNEFVEVNIDSKNPEKSTPTLIK